MPWRSSSTNSGTSSTRVSRWMRAFSEGRYEASPGPAGDSRHRANFESRHPAATNAARLKDLAMAQLPVIDVVILTWNDGALLDTAIRSVVESRDVNANVIVIDNAS